MKALKVSVLLLILIGVVAQASSEPVVTTGTFCGRSTNPAYCDPTTGEDIGCTDFCNANCVGFINVTASCDARTTGGYICNCQGTIVP